MYHDNKIWIGKSGEEKVFIYPRMANRHGMIAGATGTGKTVTLKVLAESFSDCGVPVFLAVVKGDLSGVCRAGEESESLKSRIDTMGLMEEGYGFHAYPADFWDIYGEKGLPLRATVSEMGPLLLGRILELNETQSDILTVIFKIADDEQLLLLDTKDLRSMIQRECVRVQCPVRKSCETEPGGNYESRCGIGSGGRRGIFRRTGFKSRGLAVQRL